MTSSPSALFPNPGGVPISFAAPIRLASASAFFSGEVIFVRVSDPGQNGDPTNVETVTATIESANGDAVVLRFFESGPDTGEFFAYIPSTRQSSAANDSMLAVEHDSPIVATYQDRFVDTDISTDTAGVDPFGRLFDSATGELIDGATVTIVDAATGQPAPVFGIDGVSDYPSTLVTGGSVTDASGLVYDLEPGEFVFPIMFPGVYRLEIDTPPGYTVPSILDADAFSSLPNAPFIIVDASYGGSFVLDGTGDVTFDVPLDPFSDLLVSKEASTETGAIGDFIRYAVTVENVGDRSVPVLIQDDLPRGFRYQSSTSRLDGAPQADPTISANGSSLSYNLGVLAAGESRTIAYVTEIAAGTPTGEAINTAAAVNGLGAPVSNRAQVSVLVREDLLRSRLTIVGRVVENACNPENNVPRPITDGRGVPGIRLYMETGAYVVTDENGLFHFEDVEARTHVVQLDEATLPPVMRLIGVRKTRDMPAAPTLSLSMRKADQSGAPISI